MMIRLFQYLQLNIESLSNKKFKKTVFLDNLLIKERSKKKMKALEYKTLGIQPYIISIKFSVFSLLD